MKVKISEWAKIVEKRFEVVDKKIKELESLRDMVAELRVQVQAGTGGAGGVSPDIMKQIMDLQTRISNIETKSQGLSEIMGLAPKLTQMSTEYYQLTQLSQGLKSRLDALESKIASTNILELNNKLTALETKVKLQEGQVKAHETILGDLQKKTTQPVPLPASSVSEKGLEALKLDVDQKIKELKEIFSVENTKLSREFQNLIEKVAAVEGKIGSTGTINIDLLSEKIKEIETRISEIPHAQPKGQIIELLNEKISNIEMGLEDKLMAELNVQQLYTGLSERMSQLEAAMPTSKLTEIRAEVREQFNAMENRLQAITKDIEKSKVADDIAKFKRNLGVIANQVDILNKKLAKVDKKITPEMGDILSKLSKYASKLERMDTVIRSNMVFQKDLAELRVELKNLKNEISDKMKNVVDRSIMKEQIEELVSEKTKGIKPVEIAQISGLEEKLQTISEKLALQPTPKELSALRFELAELSRKVGKLEVAQAKAGWADIFNKLRNFENRISEVEIDQRSISSSMIEIQNLKTEIDQMIKSTNLKLLEMEKIQKSITLLEKKKIIQDIKNSINAFNMKINKLERKQLDIEDLKTTISELSDRVEQIESWQKYMTDYLTQL